MKNFQRLAVGIDVGPLIHAVQRQSELWDMFPVRSYNEQNSSVEFSDIVLRYNKFDWGENYTNKVTDSVDCENYPPFALLPQARPLVFALMSRVEGEQLGRVFISKLKPGQSTPPHNDTTAPAIFYERYCGVLQSQQGCQFTSLKESVTMSPGDCWWINNQEPYSITNGSFEDAVFLFCDIRTSHFSYCPEMEKSAP